MISFILNNHEFQWCVSNVCLADDVEQISGKIDSISLSGAPGSLSDCISLSLDMQQQQPSLFGQVSVLGEVSLFLQCVLGWGGEESVVQARSKDSGPWIRLSCCASCSGNSLIIDFFISSCDLTGLLQGRFIETPEVSAQLNTPDTSANLTGGYPLQNCAKVNFLDWDWCWSDTWFVILSFVTTGSEDDK